MMASVEARRSPFSPDPHNPNLHKSIPILPSSASSLAPPRDPMDISPTPTSSMGPPTLNGAAVERPTTIHEQGRINGDTGNTSPNGNSATAVGAAAAAQQPKVVQTAFIHKLYKWVHSILPAHCRISKLMPVQYARRPKHPASHIVVEHQREFRHVAVQ